MSRKVQTPEQRLARAGKRAAKAMRVFDSVIVELEEASAAQFAVAQSKYEGANRCEDVIAGLEQQIVLVGEEADNLLDEGDRLETEALNTQERADAFRSLLGGVSFG